MGLNVHAKQKSAFLKQTSLPSLGIHLSPIQFAVSPSDKFTRSQVSFTPTRNAAMTIFPAKAQFSTTELAQAIDHTKLTFASDENQTAAIQKLCTEATASHFYAVCVRPQHIVESLDYLKGTSVKVATVIGFPADKIALDAELKHATVGNFPLAHKVEEARLAVSQNVDELDWVIDVEQFRNAETGKSALQAELKAAMAVAGKTPVKVIIETDLLNSEQMVLATVLCAQAGVAMVKTSTGMVTGGVGATLETVQRIVDTLKAQNATDTGIKASGGIKTREQAEALLALGVNRLGTSAGLSLISESQALIGADVY